MHVVAVLIFLPVWRRNNDVWCERHGAASEPGVLEHSVVLEARGAKLGASQKKKKRAPAQLLMSLPRTKSSTVNGAEDTVGPHGLDHGGVCFRRFVLHFCRCHIGRRFLPMLVEEVTPEMQESGHRSSSFGSMRRPLRRCQLSLVVHFFVSSHTRVICM